MDAEGYLNWLRNTNLEIATHSDLTEAVQAIVDALETELPSEEHGSNTMHTDLLQIQQDLNSGGLPHQKILEFRESVESEFSAREPIEVILEKELREIALGIAEERWNTEIYQDFEAAIHGFLNGGDEEILWQTVERIESIIEKAYQGYSTADVMPSEITAESMVAHNLLYEGMGQWKFALELIQDSESETGPDWDSVLDTAEQGNRLLVAVQIFEQRVQRAISLAH